MLYIIFNYLIWRFAIYHLFGEILGGTTIYSNARNFRNFLRKIYTLTIEYAIKNSPKQIHLNEKVNSGGGSLQLCLYGVCGHIIGKLTNPQSKAGLSINKNRPIQRLCTIKDELKLTTLQQVLFNFMKTTHSQVE